jgi:hypothetical protein
MAFETYGTLDHRTTLELAPRERLRRPAEALALFRPQPELQGPHLKTGAPAHTKRYPPKGFTETFFDTIERNIRKTLNLKTLMHLFLISSFFFIAYFALIPTLLAWLGGMTAVQTFAFAAGAAAIALRIFTTGMKTRRDVRARKGNPWGILAGHVTYAVATWFVFKLVALEVIDMWNTWVNLTDIHHIPGLEQATLKDGVVTDGMKYHTLSAFGKFCKELGIPVRITATVEDHFTGPDGKLTHHVEHDGTAVDFVPNGGCTPENIAKVLAADDADKNVDAYYEDDSIGNGLREAVAKILREKYHMTADQAHDLVMEHMRPVGNANGPHIHLKGPR